MKSYCTEKTLNKRFTIHHEIKDRNMRNMNKPKTEIIMKTDKALTLNEIQIRKKMKQYRTKQNITHDTI